MKVLIATHASLEISGGEERFFVTLAKSLRDRGHEVRIANYAAVFADEPRTTMESLRHSLGSIQVVNIRGLPLAGRVLPIPGIAGTFSLGAEFRWADVVVFGQYYGFDAVVNLLSWALDRPILCSQSNALFRPIRTVLRDTVQEAYQRTVGYRLLARCDAVRVCNSEDQRFLLAHGSREIVLMYPPTSEFTNSANGSPAASPQSDTIDLLSADRRFKVMVAGRMTHQKGVDLLAQTISLMALRNPNLAQEVAFYLAGSSALPRPLRSLASHMPPLIANLGVIPRGTLAPVLKAADTVLIPSRYESFGTIAVEAQSVGKPVVATDTTGLREVVVDGETGRLVRPWSPEAFAQALEQMRSTFASDPARWAQMQSASVANFERRFGPAVQAAQYVRLVTTLERLASARADAPKGPRP